RLFDCLRAFRGGNAARGVLRAELTMDALTAIGTRLSASKLGPPGPSAEERDIILKMGMRAPDHGRLSPWRFVVIQGDARAKFGEAMADIRRRQPAPTERDIQRELDKAMRAPTIVAR